PPGPPRRGEPYHRPPDLSSLRRCCRRGGRSSHRGLYSAQRKSPLEILSGHALPRNGLPSSPGHSDLTPHQGVDGALVLHSGRDGERVTTRVEPLNYRG